MIIIDAGHGGRDSGAVGNGLQEKDLSLRIAQIQKRLCDIYGIESVIIRNTDIFIDLNARCKLINASISDTTSDICISNHINSAESATAFGFEIIKKVSDESSYADDLLKMVKRSDILAVRRVYTVRNINGSDHFAINRLVKCRSYILEWGFIKNKRDMDSLMNNVIVMASLPIIAYLQDIKY